MPTAGSRVLKDSLGQATFPIFGGEETRKVLTDNFDTLVAFDPFGTSIPGRDETVRVEHVNGVVHNGIKQQFEPPGFY
jgi:hypothetical protein